MKDKICLITGATSGIGQAAALALLEMGAEVVLVGRDPEKTKRVVSELQRCSGRSSVSFLLADLSDQQQIGSLARQFRESYPRLDVLVNNAGAVFAQRELTVDGLEKTFAVNHMAYFLLTTALLDCIPVGGRIVNTSSDAHRTAHMRWHDLQICQGYNPFFAYAQSKLANVLFTRELAHRLQSRQISVNAFHPGVVRTGIWNSRNWISEWIRLGQRWMLSAAEGAKTLVYLASSPDVASATGGYFVRNHMQIPASQAMDAAAALRLWEVSQDLFSNRSGVSPV
ncbi:MAG: SDR family oxidoreductase [Deinococcaceae bacterium]